MEEYRDIQGMKIELEKAMVETRTDLNTLNTWTVVAKVAAEVALLPPSSVACGFVLILLPSWPDGDYLLTQCRCSIFPPLFLLPFFLRDKSSNQWKILKDSERYVCQEEHTQHTRNTHNLPLAFLAVGPWRSAPSVTSSIVLFTSEIRIAGQLIKCCLKGQIFHRGESA